MNEYEKLAYETLAELNNYLVKLNKGIEDTVEYFRGQQEDKGLNLLKLIIEGLQWSIDVLFKTESILITYGIEVNKEKINDLFNELVSALENQDYVLVADLLEYEILELTKDWQAELKKIDKIN